MPLTDYTLTHFTAGPYTRPVYRRGQGPAVIVIHEVPGLHTQVIAFADRLAEHGMSVWCPSLFGTPGAAPTKGAAAVQLFLNICIRREFSAWAAGRSSSIVDWLRALAKQAHDECGGPGVGALGMCFTGGFALAMMTEPAVSAPVLSQPSLPIKAAKAGSLDCSAAELACARRRFESEDLSLLALRYKSDRLVPDARFRRLERQFPGRVETIELNDEDARPDTGMAPHSVLTVHLPDAGPGRDAETRVITFLRNRLGLGQGLAPADA